MKSKRLIVGVIVLAAACVLFYVFWPRNNAPIAVDNGDTQGSQAPVLAGKSPDGEVVGGVRRPSGSIESSGGQEKADGDRAGEFDYGESPAVALDANPQVASVARAIANREKDPVSYQASVSALAPQLSFDATKYRNDKDYRQEYLESAQPARVFNPAQPGEGVVRLSRVGTPLRRVIQGDSTKLRVRAVAGMPVTFSSFDLGAFSNQLTTMTVEASSDGVAEAEFFATTGTIANVNILASSPVTSGQVKFVVDISLPQ